MYAASARTGVRSSSPYRCAQQQPVQVYAAAAALGNMKESSLVLTVGSNLTSYQLSTLLTIASNFNDFWPHVILNSYKIHYRYRQNYVFQCYGFFKVSNVKVKLFNLKVKFYNLKVTFYNLKVKIYNLMVKNYNLKVKNYNLKVTFYNLKVTFSNSKVKFNHLKVSYII